MYMTRNEASKRIKAALKAKTGKAWSVTGGRGTGYGWITVQAPKSRRVAHKPNPLYHGWMTISQCVRETGKPPWIECEADEEHGAWYTSDADSELLAEVFGTLHSNHHQGVSISPGKRELFVERVEAWEPGEEEN